MASGLNKEHTLERTEFVQEVRKKVIDELSKEAMSYRDPETANVLLAALRDYEKQELHKDKQAHDSEEADKDRAIAQDAISIANELRQQRRNRRLNNEAEHDFDPTVGIPDVEEANISEEADVAAASERKFSGTDWNTFRKKMIAEGHDPRYMLDDDGNVVPRKQNDET